MEQDWREKRAYDELMDLLKRETEIYHNMRYWKVAEQRDLQIYVNQHQFDSDRQQKEIDDIQKERKRMIDAQKKAIEDAMDAVIKSDYFKKGNQNPEAWKLTYLNQKNVA